MTVRYLTVEEILELVERLGAGPVRDYGLVDSACMRPAANVFGVEAYPTLDQKAAALIHSLIRNHALVDGNKRTAWLSTTVFLELNDAPVETSDEKAFDFILEAAQGHVDVPDIAAWLRKRMP